MLKTVGHIIDVIHWKDVHPNHQVPRKRLDQILDNGRVHAIVASFIALGLLVAAHVRHRIVRYLQ